MKNKFFKKLLLFAVILSGHIFYGQTVTGKVETAGFPLPGVNVTVKGTKNGTSTNTDGVFKLDNVAKNAKLVFSSIGFITKEVVADKQNLTVSLKEDTQSLSEVVVVGYGTSKRKDVTGAVSSLNAKAIRDLTIAGVDQAMQGRLAGVTVTQNSGTPGGGVSIRIRGIASLSNNEPLYVIDGTPFGGSDNNDSFNYSTTGGASGQTKVSALSTINPADIESIDVLKDASAAAIYGSRASNGVVLITTKKGKKGKGSISYDTYRGVQKVSKFLDVLNLRDFAKYRASINIQRNEQVPYEFQNPELLGEGTNWQKEIFRDAQITNHQVTVSGGSDNTKYYTSLNYFKQDGIVINSNFERISMRLNLDTKVNNWFKIGNSITINNTKQDVVYNDNEAGVISTALTQAPNVPVRFSDGTFGGPQEGFGNTAALNPVATAIYRTNFRGAYRIIGSLFGELNLAKGLSFKTVVGYDLNTTKNSVFFPDIQIGSVNSSSVSSRGQGQSFSWTVQNYFTYNKEYKKHNLTLLLGQEAVQGQFEGISGTRTGYFGNDITTLSAGTATSATNADYKGTNSLSSYYTRLNYSYDNKYLLTGTFRSDSSSNFGPGYKTGYFPSFSLGWIVSNESFFEPIKKVVSLLKFRGGYGELGNQNIGAYLYGASIVNFATPFGTGFAQENLQNPKVKWETAKATNIGVELGLFNDRIRLEVDAYKKISSDFLFPDPVPAFLGSNPQQGNLGLAAKVVNLGDIENKGLDITLNTNNFNTKNFNWNSTFIFSSYKNKLISFGNGTAALFRTFQFNNTLTKTGVGLPLGQFYGYEVDGIYKSEEDITNSPTPDAEVGENGKVWIGDIKFKDLNGDGKITPEDRTNIGNPIPDFTYSVINNFTYKNLDLEVVLAGTQGNKIYNWTRRLTESLGGIGGPFANQSAVVNNRFVDNVNENTNIPRYVDGDPNGNARVSNRFVEDGSYLRIQNIALGYTFSPSVMDKIKFFSKIRLYFSAQNIYTFTKYSGMDPAIGAFSQDALLSGVDNGRYPVPKIFSFGLNLNF